MHILQLVFLGIMLESGGAGIVDKSPEDIKKAWNLTQNIRTTRQMRHLLTNPYDRQKLDRWEARWMKKSTR